MTKQLSVRLGDLDQIGILIAQVTNAGAISILGNTFGVADTSELEQTAWESALICAREKAAKIAEEMAVSECLGSLRANSLGESDQRR